MANLKATVLEKRDFNSTIEQEIAELTYSQSYWATSEGLNKYKGLLTHYNCDLIRNLQHVFPPFPRSVPLTSHNLIRLPSSHSMHLIKGAAARKSL